MKTRLTLFLLACCLASIAHAVPLLVNYQGTYVDNAGVPVTQPNTAVIISIWNHPTGTDVFLNRKYQENHIVNISDGNFSLKIGSGSSPSGTFDANLFDTTEDRYLQLTINGEIMLPRVRFLSAPYTLQSENSARFGNQLPAYYATAADLTTLQNSLGNEVSNRTGDVDAEESARIAADNNLQSQINSEISTRSSADTTLQNNINTANTTRASADTTLQNNINTANSTRASADTTLQNNINTEITNRTSADLENMEALCKASPGSVWVASKSLCVGGSVNLGSIDLSGIALNGVYLYGATITKTDFSGANLSGAFFRNVSYTTTSGNQPVFDSTNLTNATLTGMSLVNAALSNSTLTNLYTNNITACPASLPTNWSCVTYDGSLKRLIGPYARFYSPNGELQPAGWSTISFPANLAGVNFMYNRFHTCSFNSNTNFTNTNLRGATFVSCNILPGGTVTWSNTTCPDGSNTNSNGKGTCVGQGM